MSVPNRQIRAVHTADTITVYQAYAERIARPAVRHGRFVPPFKRGRMTWIKPSFLWMMYRCGWATKPDQERVLAIEVSRAGFDWALAHACLSHHGTAGGDREAWRHQLTASPVRVQWDPERSLRLAALPHRALQLGLGGEAVNRYVTEWTIGIRDVTPVVHQIRALLDAGDDSAAARLLPVERPYPVPAELRARIGMDDPPNR